MSVERFEFTIHYGVVSGNEYARHHISQASMLSKEDGSYVRYKDYAHLSEYCDHLIQFSKLPCLPKDLEVLRNANVAFATENQKLQQENEEMAKKITQLRGDLHAALKMRDKWFCKWKEVSKNCGDKIDKIKVFIDQLDQKVANPH